MSCQTRNGTEAQHKSGRRGPGERASARREDSASHPPANPFLCRRRKKSANQPKLTDGPTHLDDVPDVELRLGLGPDRAAEAEAHGCVWFSTGTTVSQSVLLLCGFGRQVKLKSIILCPYSPELPVWRNRKSCLVSGTIRTNPPKRIESLSIF